MENKSHVPNHQPVVTSIYYPNPIGKTLVAVPLLLRRTCRGSWAPAQVRRSDSKWGGHSPWVPLAESHDILCICIYICVLNMYIYIYIYEYVKIYIFIYIYIYPGHIIWVYNRINIYHVSLFHQPEKFSYDGIVTPKHHSRGLCILLAESHGCITNLRGAPLATLVYNLPRANVFMGDSL